MPPTPPSGQITSHIFRLNPGDSLVPSIREKTDVIFAQHSHCSAFILTAVGSLKDVTLRLANASRTNDGREDAKDSGGDGNDIRRWENQRFEIVSLVGTISTKSNGHHLHISLSDAEGQTIGGHLIDGIVFTTVEIVLGTVADIELAREHDEKTGYRELVARQIIKKEKAADGETEDPSCSGSFSWITGNQMVVLMALLTGVAIGVTLQKRR